jgi:hypothetical protein
VSPVRVRVSPSPKAPANRRCGAPRVSGYAPRKRAESQTSASRGACRVAIVVARRQDPQIRRGAARPVRDRVRVAKRRQPNMGCPNRSHLLWHAPTAGGFELLARRGGNGERFGQRRIDDSSVRGLRAADGPTRRRDLSGTRKPLDRRRVRSTGSAERAPQARTSLVGRSHGRPVGLAVRVRGEPIDVARAAPETGVGRPLDRESAVAVGQARRLRHLCCRGPVPTRRVAEPFLVKTG